MRPKMLLCEKLDSSDDSSNAPPPETKWWNGILGLGSSTSRDDQDTEELDSASGGEEDTENRNPQETFLPDAVKRMFEFRQPGFAKTPDVETKKLKKIRARSMEKSEARELDKRRKAEARAEQILLRERKARSELEKRRREREEWREREERRKEVDDFRRNLKLGRGPKAESPRPTPPPSTPSALSWLPSLPSSLLVNRGKWVDLIPKTDISPGELVPVTLLGIDLLVVAPAPPVLENNGLNRNNLNVYVIANSCPHLGTPLETGQLTLDSECGKTCVTCPLHKSKFKLEDGGSVGDWCPYPVFYGELFGGDRKELGVFEVR